MNMWFESFIVKHLHQLSNLWKKYDKKVEIEFTLENVKKIQHQIILQCDEAVKFVIEESNRNLVNFNSFIYTMKRIISRSKFF
jgi:hypothetical protein